MMPIYLDYDTIKPKDRDLVFNDLKNKLCSLYGDGKEASFLFYSNWMWDFSSSSGGTIYLVKSPRNAIHLTYMYLEGYISRARSMQEAADSRDELENVGNGNTDGL